MRFGTASLLSICCCSKAAGESLAEHGCEWFTGKFAPINGGRRTGTPPFIDGFRADSGVVVGRPSRPAFPSAGWFASCDGWNDARCGGGGGSPGGAHVALAAPLDRLLQPIGEHPIFGPSAHGINLRDGATSAASHNPAIRSGPHQSGQSCVSQAACADPHPTGRDLAAAVD